MPKQCLNWYFIILLTILEKRMVLNGLVYTVRKLILFGLINFIQTPNMYHSGKILIHFGLKDSLRRSHVRIVYKFCADDNSSQNRSTVFKLLLIISHYSIKTPIDIEFKRSMVKVSGYNFVSV